MAGMEIPRKSFRKTFLSKVYYHERAGKASRGFEVGDGSFGILLLYVKEGRKVPVLTSIEKFLIKRCGTGVLGFGGPIPV